MKPSIVILLLYYLLVEVTEFVVESNFYDYGNDSWTFIAITQAAFSALMILPAPILLASRFFQIKNDTSGYLSSKSWLTVLFLISLIALLGVSAISYQRVHAAKEKYDVMISGSKN